jgi:hypothetical protein
MELTKHSFFYLIGDARNSHIRGAFNICFFAIDLHHLLDQKEIKAAQ